MAANTLEFNDFAPVLRDMTALATGVKQPQIVNTSDFVSVAQTALLAGYDSLIKAVSQVLSRTIFSIRPYTALFKGIRVDNIKFGNHVRKLNISDKDWQSDVARFVMDDDYKADMFKIDKPNILQTNFYGQNPFKRHYTIFKDQLDVAFTGPDQFQQFITMITTNCSDIIEQCHEILARAVLANFVGGIIAGDDDAPERVIHCVTEYNAATGENVTPETVYSNENFSSFMKWLNSRIDDICSLMRERSVLFHTNVTGKPLARHTPYSKQKVYLYSPAMYQLNSRVLADTYHDGYVKYADKERVSFWQSIINRDSLNVKPVFLKKDGTLDYSQTVNKNGIFGVIFDEEALGYTVVNQWSAATPFEADGGYSNVWFHFNDRFWNDFTENGVVLLLD